MMALRHIIKIAALLIPVAIVASLFASGTANAATISKPRSTHAVTITFPSAAPANGPSVSRSARRQSGAGLGLAPDQVTISCTLSIEDPHNSTHVPGTVNVVAGVTCTSDVVTISLSVFLGDSNGRLQEEDFTGNGTDELPGNAALDCEDGDYEGLAEAEVVMPPDFEPPTLTMDVESPEEAITC